MLTLMEILNKRTQFEDITKDFSMDQDSTKSGIDTIEWFIENGHRSNSLRNGFTEAKSIAEDIKEYADGCAEEARAWELLRPL